MLKEVYEKIVAEGYINVMDVLAHNGGGGGGDGHTRAYFCKIQFNMLPSSIPFNFEYFSYLSDAPYMPVPLSHVGC
jgi:hypothetical protein